MKMVVLTVNSIYFKFFHWLHRKLEGCYFLSTRKCCHDEGGAGSWGGDVRCFSTVISGMFGLLEKCKESERGFKPSVGIRSEGCYKKSSESCGEI